MPALCQEKKIILPGELILNKKKPAATYFLRSLRSLPTFCSASLRKSRGGLSSQDTPKYKTAHKREKKCLFLRTGIQFKKKKPAASYFHRSPSATLPRFASLRFAKLAAVPRRVRGTPDGADCKRGKNACYQKYALS